MKPAYIIILIAMLLPGGCRTSRFSSHRNEKSNVEQKSDIHETISAKTDTHTVKKLSEKSELRQKEIEMTTVVKWSPPDSTGKQYPVETVTKNRQAVTGIQMDDLAEKEEKTTTEAAEIREDKSMTSAESEIKTAEESKTETSSPAWITWMAVILSLGIIMLIYFILKRYRIVR